MGTRRQAVSDRQRIKDLKKQVKTLQKYIDEGVKADLKRNQRHYRDGQRSGIHVACKILQGTARDIFASARAVRELSSAGDSYGRRMRREQIEALESKGKLLMTLVATTDRLANNQLTKEINDKDGREQNEKVDF